MQVVILMILIAMILGCMHNAQGAGTGYRIPPQYNPDDPNQTFRAWVTDLMQWVMLTDLAPHQQAAAIAARLEGTARDMGRTLTPAEMMNGGIIDGRQLDPVTYIVAGLHRNFAQLDEESRLGAMTELLAFRRHHNENISSMLARYELVRNRARQEGNFDMNIEGNAFQILRAIQCTTNQFVEFLRPFQGRLPNTDAEYRRLLGDMRRTYRIVEHAPNNLGQYVLGPNREARHNQYYADDRVSDHQHFLGLQESSPSLWDMPYQPLPTDAAVPRDMATSGATSSSYLANNPPET